MGIKNHPSYYEPGLKHTAVKGTAALHTEATAQVLSSGTAFFQMNDCRLLLSYLCSDFTFCKSYYEIEITQSLLLQIST